MRWIRVNDLPRSEWAPPGLGRRTYLAEVRAGRLRAVQVSGRKTWITSAEWIAEWIEQLELKREVPGRPAVNRTAR
jgi:hypothetical protein